MTRAEEAAASLRDRGYLVTDPRAWAMSETELDSSIRALAADLGLRRFHPFDSRKSDRGWPDLVLVGKGGILFRELKRQREKPTPAQQAWLDALSAAGADAGCWRPSSLLSGQIARELAAIAGLAVSRGTP